ncbi:hypothetical protein [Paraburkholderia sp. HD33-4]|uniref:hypothetical protein n=1 Tax=Paraburkholderia sp. HD33-4 TaxID=2883242 RepID=UPI001F21F57C|nr:hypothetical protein [Paraburkholderia sp. HD33-4]
MNKLKLALLLVVAAVAVALHVVAGPAVAGLFCAATFMVWCLIGRTRRVNAPRVDEGVEMSKFIRARELMDHNR